MSRARDFADLAGSADAGGLTGRNLIINGAMQVAISGRFHGHLVRLSISYGIDRFLTFTGVQMAHLQSERTTVPARQDFKNCMENRRQQQMRLSCGLVICCFNTQIEKATCYNN